MTRLRDLTIYLIVALLAMASCDKQEDIDRAYTDYRYDIVTYLGQNAIGAVFEYWGHGDSTAIRMQSIEDVSKDVKPDQRVLLRYDFASQQVGNSRDITVYGCNTIISDSLRQAQGADSLIRHEMKLRSLWRTGPYLNLRCQVEYTGKNRTFMLVADENTLSNDTVHCYLVHDLRGERPSFWRDCYASFSIGALWKRPSVQCMRVHLNDLTYPDTEYYDFNK